jgi:hypothetical protein
MVPVAYRSTIQVAGGRDHDHRDTLKLKIGHSCPADSLTQTRSQPIVSPPVLLNGPNLLSQSLA